MDERSDLSTILRDLPSGGQDVEVGLNQRILHFNRGSGKIVTKLPIIGRSRVRDYLVTTDKEVEFRTTYPILESEGGRGELRAEVRCRISIPRNAEAKVVEALCKEDSPEAQLRTMIRSAVKAFYKRQKESGKDPALEFFELKNSWEQSVAKRLSHETSLKASVTLDVGDPPKSVLSLETGPTRVNVSDCRIDLIFKLKASLDLLPDGRLELMHNLRRTEELKNEIAESVRRFISDNYSINDLFPRASALSKAREEGEGRGRPGPSGLTDVKSATSLSTSRDRSSCPGWRAPRGSDTAARSRTGARRLRSSTPGPHETRERQGLPGACRVSNKTVHQWLRDTWCRRLRAEFCSDIRISKLPRDSSGTRHLRPKRRRKPFPGRTTSEPSRTRSGPGSRRKRSDLVFRSCSTARFPMCRRFG